MTASTGDSHRAPAASTWWTVLEEFIGALWNSGVFRLFPMLFLYIAGFGVILPFIPNLMTDFFASDSAGHAVQCELYDPKDKPECCIEASNTVVMWSSLTGFLTNTVLLFLLSPMTGVWSDVLGRKPFIIVGQLLSLLPKFVLWLHLSVGLTLYLYYPLDVFNGAISPVVSSLAYVADVVEPKYRQAGFGLVLAAFALGIAVTPKIGFALGMKVAIVSGVWLKIIGIVYTCWLLPESMTKEARALARQKLQERKQREADAAAVRDGRPGGGVAAPLAYVSGAVLSFPPIKSMTQGFAILLRYPQFIKLTVCLMISGLVANGLSDVDSQYFILLFNFTPADFSNMYLIFGGGTLIVQVLLMQPVLSYLGERGCLVIAFLAAVARASGLAASQSKLDAYLSLIVGTVSVMAFPSIASIKANNVGPHEQGAVQGALSGAQALAQGVGPLIFMRLFRTFTREDFYLPRAVPAIAAVICVIPVALVASINMQKLAIRSQEGARDEVGEPLLGGDADGNGAAREEGEGAACVGGPHHFEGHDVMAEEAPFAHKEGDLTPGLLLEGDLLHYHAHHEGRGDSAGPSSQRGPGARDAGNALEAPAAQPSPSSFPIVHNGDAPEVVVSLHDAPARSGRLLSADDREGAGPAPR